MANFVLTSFITSQGALEDVATALEVQLETVTNTKNIRLIEIYPVNNRGSEFVGVAIYDT